MNFKNCIILFSYIEKVSMNFKIIFIILFLASLVFSKNKYFIGLDTGVNTILEIEFEKSSGIEGDLWDYPFPFAGIQFEIKPKNKFIGIGFDVDYHFNDWFEHDISISIPITFYIKRIFFLSGGLSIIIPEANNIKRPFPPYLWFTLFNDFGWNIKIYKKLFFIPKLRVESYDLELKSIEFYLFFRVKQYINFGIRF